MQYIKITDYLLLPFFLLVVFFVATKFRNQKYPHGHPWRPYFMPTLVAKVSGALLIALIYVYYYNGADTTHYFTSAEILNSSFSESGPSTWANLLFRIPSLYDSEYAHYIERLDFYGIPSGHLVVSFAAILNLLTFGTFLNTSLLFGVFSFTGVWAMFRTFAAQYPHLTKHLALGLLFIPSTIMWGSGIFKDTVCMFGLGWMMYGTFTILIQRKFKPITLLITIVSFILVVKIKIYIIVAFLPAITLWLFLQYSYKIKERSVRFIIKLFIIGGGFAAFSFVSSQFSDVLGEYSLDKIAQTSVKTNANILSITSDEGSSYNIGDVDPSLTGMLKKFPAAVNVSLFRPYLWEAKNIFSFLNAIEAFLILIFTIKLFFKIGPVNINKAINSDPNIQFFLIFSIVFAFAVGLSSGNFGTLSRYRIPCLPPYVTAIILIYYKYTNPNEPFLTLK